MNRPAKVLILAALSAATALAQEKVVVTRQGDGTVTVPAGGGDVTVTTRTHGLSSFQRIPQRGARFTEKQLDRFLKEREGRDEGWT